MRVTPGSDTLWSVHSGHFCWTSRFASSTRSWKRRSSRFGTGRAMSRRSCYLGLAGRFLGRDHVERKDEVARVVGGAERVAHVDVEHGLVGRIGVDRDALQLDSGLPALERDPDLGG